MKCVGEDARCFILRHVCVPSHDKFSADTQAPTSEPVNILLLCPFHDQYETMHMRFNPVQTVFCFRLICLLRIGIRHTGQVVNTQAKWVSGILPTPIGATRYNFSVCTRRYVTYLQVCRLLVLHICCMRSVESIPYYLLTFSHTKSTALGLRR
jgi:hypothetical protein